MNKTRKLWYLTTVLVTITIAGLGFATFSVSAEALAETGNATILPDTAVDFNGDGKTDFAVVKVAGVPNNQMRWFYSINGSGNTVGLDWGLTSDIFLTDDFDGDGKDDVTVWRPDPGGSVFYILQSQTGTIRVEGFGVTGDDPSIVGDYDGDNRADLAVYRPGPSIGSQSTWYYKGSLNNPGGNISSVNWGVTGDKRAPGDYDGDGKNDFVIFRLAGDVGGAFWKLTATGVVSVDSFGSFSVDSPVPGDYDGDGKTDVAVVRGYGSFVNYIWFVLPSGGGPIRWIPFGRGSLTGTDYPVQGDYDGDGKTDVAVWREGGEFWIINSGSSTIQNFILGTGPFLPVAAYNAHRNGL